MKALRNPMVSGFFVVTAFVVVFRTIFAGPEDYGQAQASAAASEGDPSIAKPEFEMPEIGIDPTLLKWAATPRDPFRLNPAPAPEIAEPPDEDLAPPGSARDSLELTAIWVQQKRRLAVVNGLIVGEGDSVMHFRIEKILADRILVRGLERIEVLPFKVSNTAPIQARAKTKTR